MLNNKTIVVGVTGGIAAYKTCEIVSRLVKLGADVWVVMTREAAELVTPLTFRTLSGNPVITNLFDPGLSSLPVLHIAIADKADLILIAPCTANMIGKITGGIADDALTTIVMASKAPKIIAPAMNPNMWENQIVKENVEKLKKLNFKFIGPCEGMLACGVEDIGRMAEPEEIIEKIVGLLGVKQDLKGKQVLVTAGGTTEAIDPVRYISNRSSGKMGYAIAEAARERGAEVTLITAPTNLSVPLDVKVVRVESAAEMLDAVLQNYSKADVVIMAAAVGDYTVNTATSSPTTYDLRLTTKIKKSNKKLMLKLSPTEDILRTLARRKDRKGKIHVGFALETENLIKNAKQKLKEKELDMIVANGPETFGSDNIQFSIVKRSGEAVKYNKITKEKAAQIIISKIVGR
ncbi:MAG: bifunctional phosphopantothenoylcysteine decarboxylase/phosphopantothenate--cysteine ligase CoaBC [Candidatus Margulisbacteria bacterium]|nr:bifunctional phosphopantothenoylcysteine decarboxylase/phosphopantothenate--cysteine ligase CoaBC [Candidatus Margulisiibacteriota bacterium]